METKLRVLPRDFKGKLEPGDVYYDDYIKDWRVCLPIREPNRFLPFIEFALNTCASSCTKHPDKPNPHRCWDISGDKELDNGDASKLTVHPSILIEYDPGKSIHGYITNGIWKEC